MNGIDFDYINEDKPVKGLAKWAKMQLNQISKQDFVRSLALDATRQIVPFYLNITFSNVYTVSYLVGLHNN